MRAAENPSPHIRGKQEIRELALAAFTALDEADLGYEGDRLHQAVFSRDSTALFQTAEVEPYVWQWSFSPSIELLLRHVTEIAAQESRSIEERRQEITWAMEAFGL
jgi:hypothetical protein